MAAETYSSPECSNGKTKRKRLTVNKELERLDSLPWNPSFPDNKDTRSFLVGSNNLEGGFLSLEEIDEFEYGLEIPSLERESKREKFSKYSKTTKKKWKDDGDNGGDESLDVIECGNKDGANELKDVKKEMKKKKKKKTMKLKEARKNAESVTEMQVDETEFYAWNELRLDPLLMKSIHRLGFKEPTPIQKACIPAAAHRGKDVVGAAETGSGKTLAFGLPILQRLLEEREKVAKLLEEKVEMVENYASEAFLRALIVTPTRELALQVTDHLKNVAEGTGVRVVPVVGGMSMEKQERLLKARPEIVVGTPGRLWELISGGENHLAELHFLSFFVLDEADRMIESGHFHELQSIIDMLPMNGGSIEQIPQTTSCATFSSAQRKKRQTLFFSATVALSSDFRKKLKRGSLKSKHFAFDGLNSIETLSQRAGMKPDAAIIDLTNESILAKKLEEAFIECREEDKDAYLYYILSFHGQGHTIVFCTSIAALRHISSLLHILKMDNVFTLHAQMQQRARLKAIDRFRGHECGVLVATDVAARGLDVPGVRTVVHYQLPHSADVYVHRSGRTARASSDGCSVALISPKDRSKFASLCKSFSKETFWRFPRDDSYMRDIIKRLSLACQIDKISRKDSQEKAKKGWFEKNAEAVGLVVDENDNEEERASSHKKKKASSMHLERLKQELGVLLSRSLRPGTFTAKYPAAAGVPLSVQCQFEELAKQRKSDESNKKRKTSVIGRDCVEAIDALRCDGLEVHIDVKEAAEKRRKMEDTRRKRKQQKTRIRDLRRKQRKRDKGLIE